MKNDPTRTGTPRLGGLVSALMVSLGCASLQLHGQDCDVNDVADAVHIEPGTKNDCNSSGIPDICELVPLVFGEGGEPQAAIAGDLDGDGRSDLVVASAQGADGSTLSVFFGQATGDLAPGFTLETRAVTALEAIDLDADGNLDLVTAHGDVVRIHPGDAMGGFAEPLEVATAPGTEGSLGVGILIQLRIYRQNPEPFHGWHHPRPLSHVLLNMQQHASEAVANLLKRD